MMTMESKDLTPGTRLRYIGGNTDCEVVTIERRKDDDSGWWMTDKSGIADFVLDDSPAWIVEPPAAPPRNYEITVEDAASLRAFLDGLNQLCGTSQVDLDPSYGGIEIGGKTIGQLRKNYDHNVFVIDVSNR